MEAYTTFVVHSILTDPFCGSLSLLINLWFTLSLLIPFVVYSIFTAPFCGTLYLLIPFVVHSIFTDPFCGSLYPH